jgi:predicted RNase H-like HicB family nuclease
MSYKVSVVVEKDENGFYAYSPELKGCQTQGDTLDEVMSNMREAVELYMGTLDPDERADRMSRDILTTSVEVEVG